MKPYPLRVAGTSWRPWLGMAGLAVVTFVLFAGRRVQPTDEAWFFWVTYRLDHGAVLYRDVYSVTTPLSFWLSLAAVKVAGAQLLVIRALSVACFVATIELLRRLAARRRLGGRGQVLLVAAIFVFGSPVAHAIALYSGLAIALAVASWLVLETRGRTRSRWRLAFVGMLAGLCFQTKPNIGVFVFIAVAVTLAADIRSSEDRSHLGFDIGVVAAAFVVAVGAVFAAVAATRGLQGYLDYVFLNKGAYIDAGMTYVDALRGALHLESGAPGWLAFANLLLSAVIFVPIAAVAALVRGWVRAPQPRRLLVAPTAFTCVGLASLVPRPTPTHVAAAAPLLITGPLLVVRTAHPSAWRFRWSRLAAGSAAAVLTLSLGGLVARSIAGLAGDHSPRRHLATTPTASPQASRLRAELTRLRTTTGGKVFIVKADAGLLYLIGNLTDPLPFDIPERTDFGPGDEADAIRAIDHTRVRFICLDPNSGHRRPRARLSPLKVERYVRHHFRAVADFGTCRLYQRART